MLPLSRFTWHLQVLLQSLEIVRKLNKLLFCRAWKTYKLSKGPKFALERVKPATDLTADMLAKWVCAHVLWYLHVEMRGSKLTVTPEHMIDTSVLPAFCMLLLRIHAFNLRVESTWSWNILHAHMSI